MTKWFHRCNLDWLRARQQCLTATDVKELLPFTKTGRKRTITDEQYLRVLAGKKVELTEADCVSTGAAARGHILEPYAINLFNGESSERLFHWDDVIVTKDKHVPFGLAFSPDAMNRDIVRRPDQRLVASDAEVIGEVKSYSPERHLLCGHTPKEQLEERWQIATAMAVCKTIEKAWLLFYNPSMKEELYCVDYSRANLADEIKAVLEVEKAWLEWLEQYDKLAKHYLVKGDPAKEQEIIAEIMKKEELNPENMRSVVR